MPLPSTPAPKFIFRRPQPRETPQAVSSPRFVTPRVTHGPVATPTPSQLFLTSSARRGYTDEIESSPPESPVEESGWLAEDGEVERELKRRRISVSPAVEDGESRLRDNRDTTSSPSGGRVQLAYRDDDIESSSPASFAAPSDKIGGKHSDGVGVDARDARDEIESFQPDVGIGLSGGRIYTSPDAAEEARVRLAGENVDRDAIVDTEDDSSGPPSEPPDNRETRPTPQQPKFQAPPPFKHPDLRPETHFEGLPPAFSPQRKGAKYVPGGLAAEVQGWLSHIKGSREVGAGLRIRVSEVREGGRMYIVRGRRLDTPGVAAEGDAVEKAEIRVLLAGEGEMTGLGESVRVVEGCVIEAGGLRWDVELDGFGRWTVACDWRVSGDVAL